MTEPDMCSCWDPACEYHTVLVCGSGAAGNCVLAWQPHEHPDWDGNVCGPCRETTAVVTS